MVCTFSRSSRPYRYIVPSASVTVAMGSSSQRPAQPVWCRLTEVTPAFDISVMNAATTSRAPAAMPQVPMWTVTWDSLRPWRRSMSALAFSAIAINWSGLVILSAMSGAPLREHGLLGVLRQDRVHALGLDAVVDVVVHGDDGGETASAEAARDLEREHAVLGGAADVDAQFLLEGVQHLDAAAHVAGGPHACLLYTSPSPRDRTRSRMPSS